MSKIYLFLPDFRALVKSTLSINESQGPNHSVFYYEDEVQIYFYKPVGSFVYCFQSLKNVSTGDSSSDVTDMIGLTQVELDDLKREFQAIEVPRKLYVTHIETTTTGVLRG